MLTKRARRGSATVEFAIGFTVFILLLFPLINLIGLAMAAGTQYLLTVHGASSASASTTFADALVAMETTARDVTSSGFGQFGKLQPVGGFSASGTDLFVEVTKIDPTQTTIYGPNSPFAGAIDEEKNIYEYQVRSTFDVGPFVNLSAFPFIGNVPALGRPARLTFVAQRIVEHADGLAFGGQGASVASGSYTPPGLPSPPGSPSPIADGAGGAGSLPEDGVITYTTKVETKNGWYEVIIIARRDPEKKIYDFKITGKPIALSDGTTDITGQYDADGKEGAGSSEGPGSDEAFETAFDETIDGTDTDKFLESLHEEMTESAEGGIANVKLSAEAQAVFDVAWSDFEGWASSVQPFNFN